MSEDNAPAYACLEDWVSQWLSPTINHRLGDQSQPGECWCEQWWDHAEALNRIYALWQEWEVARATSQMSTWWIYHFESHWRALTGEDGPFRECHPALHGESSKHIPDKALPCQPMPPETMAALPEGIPPHQDNPL
ncbi:DUF4913 domain-containing protein [Natronoglycomyces albus]|uniref:DUF4913 domain-containing protein n=1 Tax=Natronoglycomyces albus TaxID=2811108 RepID=A0A895XNG3_9ACTN|nr:DUF4913 domain-containing protein [Natronoglycomyces albus]QSB07181.1 DUF4913 domain-containing protein [Natronoglycomyces albus]